VQFTHYVLTHLPFSNILIYVHCSLTERERLQPIGDMVRVFELRSRDCGFNSTPVLFAQCLCAMQYNFILAEGHWCSKNSFVTRGSDLQRLHYPKIMMPLHSLPLQMLVRFLQAQPDSVANHVTARLISMNVSNA